MGERFKYTLMQLQIQPSYTGIAPLLGRMMSNIVGSGWENCHMADECTHVATLFLE
jgi:hypothetical protein